MFTLKKILLLLFLNVLLILYVFYVVNISRTNVVMGYLPNVYNHKLEDGLLKLDKYEVSVSFVDSYLEKDTIIYTEPKANAIVYDKQVITLFVSKGENNIKYLNLENEMYEEHIEYINNLKNSYNIDVIITYIEDSNLLDGLIYEQKTDDVYIDRGERIEFIVGKNKETIVLPSFVGWHYQDVILYANSNNIRIEIEYVEFFYQEDYVIGQSVSGGTLVMKNSNPIIIYLAKKL